MQTAILRVKDKNGEITEISPIIIDKVLIDGSGIVDSIIDGSITEVTSGVDSIRTGAFQNCKKLTEAIFPSATSVGASAFSMCHKLETVDLGNTTSIGTSAFNACSSLTTVILRSTTMASGASAFDYAYHFTGAGNTVKDGYFYVPSALVDSYTTDTAWTKFAGHFRALEEYTVDGTITGELAPEKVAASDGATPEPT